MKNPVAIQISLNRHNVSYDHVVEIGRHMLSVAMKGEHLANLSRIPEVYEQDPMFVIRISIAARKIIQSQLAEQTINATLLGFEQMEQGFFRTSFRFKSGHEEIERLFSRH